MPLQRPLGATEQAIWLRDRAAPLHFLLTARIRGSIHPPLLLHALQRLQQRHPLLRVNIALSSGKQPYFVEHAAPIPCRILQRQGEQHWQAEAARELTHPFVWTDAPLVRVVLLQAATVAELMLICHHSIADGLAAVNLIQEILLLLTNPDAALPTRPLPPPLEALFPNRKPPPAIQTLLARGVLGWQQIRQRINQSSRQEAFGAVPELQIEAGQLSPETTRQLVQRCRQEGTTVHAAICTAWLFAIAVSQPHVLEQPLSCFSPVNLRSYCQSNLNQDCGVYIAPMRTLIP